MTSNKKKFKLNFDKYCESCNKKIRFYHKLDFLLTDPDTNRIVRKDKYSPEQLEEMHLIVNLFHARCLKQIVNDAHKQITEFMKHNKKYNIRDKDLR